MESVLVNASTICIPSPPLRVFRRRKRESREVHRASEYAQKVRGMRAKQHNQKRFKEKIEMKKKLVYLLCSQRHNTSFFSLLLSLPRAALLCTMKRMSSTVLITFLKAPCPRICSIVRASLVPKCCLTRSSKREKRRRVSVQWGPGLHKAWCITRATATAAGWEVGCASAQGEAHS